MPGHFRKNRRRATDLAQVDFPPEQKEVLSHVEDLLAEDGSTLAAATSELRYIYVSGEPGTGKTEVMIHACPRAALSGCHVLIMCPTGTLVHSYRDWVPDHPNIIVETIHSALVLKRWYDAAVQYAPPSRLRRYDLIMIDGVAQTDDDLLEKLRMAITELPKRLVLPVLLSGDFYQLGPMAAQRAILRWLLDYFSSARYPKLRASLGAVRSRQSSM